MWEKISCMPWQKQHLLERVTLSTWPLHATNGEFGSTFYFRNVRNVCQVPFGVFYCKISLAWKFCVNSHFIILSDFQLVFRTNFSFYRETPKHLEVGDNWPWKRCGWEALAENDKGSDMAYVFTTLPWCMLLLYYIKPVHTVFKSPLTSKRLRGASEEKNCWGKTPACDVIPAKV